MHGLAQDSVYKQNAMTKQLREEIDWVGLRKDQLIEAAFNLKEVSSQLVAIEEMEKLIKNFRLEDWRNCQISMKSDERSIELEIQERAEELLYGNKDNGK